MKQSLPKHSLNTYALLILSESKYPGCTRLAEIRLIPNSDAYGGLRLQQFSSSAENIADAHWCQLKQKLL
ncbi:hypothetical protein [uncultured Nostoc sp.]|uniref:hypothetical protein n=1 Tax=uncultured Nostoc sp. TaxID=340711 RepID=UPI0035C9FEBD